MVLKKTAEVHIEKYFVISGEVYCVQGYHSCEIQPSYFSLTMNCFGTNISAFIHQWASLNGHYIKNCKSTDMLQFISQPDAYTLAWNHDKHIFHLAPE